MAKPTQRVVNVKPVTFNTHLVSHDAEQIIFEVKDASGNIGHIAIPWPHVGFMLQVIYRAAEDAGKKRELLGKPAFFDGVTALTAQIVEGFQVSALPEKKMKVLSLKSPAGFRCDFAIPTDKLDLRGRPFPQGIAEELVAEPLERQQRPH
jgi:hypothetical protein